MFIKIKDKLYNLGLFYRITIHIDSQGFHHIRFWPSTDRFIDTFALNKEEGKYYWNKIQRMVGTADQLKFKPITIDYEDKYHDSIIGN